MIEAISDGFLYRLIHVDYKKTNNAKHQYYISGIWHIESNSYPYGDTFIFDNSILSNATNHLDFGGKTYQIVLLDDYIAALRNLRANGDSGLVSNSKYYDEDNECTVAIDFMGRHWDYQDWLELATYIDHGEKEENMYPVTKNDEVDTYDNIPEGSHLYVIRVGDDMYLTNYTEGADGKLNEAVFNRNPKSLPILYLTDETVDAFANQVGGISIRLDVKK